MTYMKADIPVSDCLGYSPEGRLYLSETALPDDLEQLEGVDGKMLILCQGKLSILSQRRLLYVTHLIGLERHLQMNSSISRR
jgi:hypothetical protein